MENNMREHINIFKNFKPVINEAVKTVCQTNGAIFHTDLSNDKIEITVDIPFDLKLSEKEAKLLEANIHNALELVLKPYFIKKD